MKTRSKISMAMPYCLNKVLKMRKTTMVKKVFHPLQSKHLLVTTIFASFCCLSASLANAAPAISSITGSISHGSSITINGTGFGVKSPAAPYLWANFDDGSSQPSSLGQIRSWTVNNFTPTAGVGVRNTVGMQSYLWNNQEMNFSATMGTTPSGFAWNNYGQPLYIFRKGKRNWAVTDSMNWKNLRLWYGGGSLYTATGNGNIAEEGYPNAFWMCAWNSPMSAQCKDGITVEQTRGHSDGRWNTEQYIVRAQSGAGQTNGYFEYIVNGRRAAVAPYFDYAQKVFVMAQGTPGEAWFVHDQSANDPDPPSGARTWWDDIYVDRTWARVMLTNQPTWGTSSTGPLYEIQIPTAWSNTNVTVQINIGEFSNGATAYLYVVDANGDANASGFPVTIGGSGEGGLTAPTLTIQSITQ